jgi:hypothetical protein
MFVGGEPIVFLSVTIQRQFAIANVVAAVLQTLSKFAASITMMLDRDFLRRL